MSPQSGNYIWQTAEWGRALRWDNEVLLPILSRLRRSQGRLEGMVASLGIELGRQVELDALTSEAVTTSAIEGEELNRESVRSSVARRLGLDAAGLPTADQRGDGVVEMLLDATKRYEAPLTEERLKGWQAALLPTGYSGLRRVVVGDWRRSDEPMQVVSGPIGRERVHFEAPPSARVPKEMQRFLSWWESSRAQMDGLLRAAVAHLWFVTIHPFEDGNGRVGRAVADMAMAQDEQTPIRGYSMSAQIQKERDTYYDVLEGTQKGDGDVTPWLVWFIECLGRAIDGACQEVDQALAKARFWQRHGLAELNARQVKVLNRLLDAGPGGFQGGITTKKYAHLTKTSPATAKRELTDLRDKGMIRQRAGTAGRSTSYDVVW